MSPLADYPQDAVGEHAEVEFTSLTPREIHLIEEIGDGVTSVVFRGSYKGMEVAVKELTCDISTMSKQARTNLERELTILKSVKHPALVKFLGVADETSKVKIVTEFCAGGTAFDLLHNSNLLLSWEQKLKMLVQVAGAMEYLHGFNPPIIHRDLKSLNLLLLDEVQTETDEPVVKLTDFGLSKILDAKALGQVMTKDAGTCHWMAPEVFSSNSYGIKADVYSWSMIMYETLCQDVPFGDVKANRVGLLVVRGKRPDLELVPPDCPLSLLDLMIKCWAPLPEDRPDFVIINERLHA